jgi:PAS domain S-box-containing protein
MSDFHIPTAFQLAGIITLVMPAFTWWTLSKSPSTKLGLWCASGILLGVGTLLFGLRLHVPAWVSYPLANFLAVLGCLVRIQSLRHEIGKPWPSAWIALVAIVSIVIFEFIRVGLEDVVLRIGYIHALLLVLFGYMAFLALQIGRRLRNRSALVIAGFHVLLVAGFLLRMSELVYGAINANMMATTYGGILIAVAGLLTGAVSHMAYVGMQLELTQDKLITVEGEYQGILNTTPDGFVLANAEGNCVDVNEIYCRMLGYARTEVLRMNIRDIKEISDSEAIPEMLHRIRDKGFDRYESRHRCSDGRLLDVEVSVTYMPAPANKFVFLLRDISERKQAQLELERRVSVRTAELATARAEAESANAVKTRFMSNVSHEMRTPMQGILGFVQIGKGKVGNSSPEKLREYFEKIEQSGRRLHQLIESLLKLAEAAWTEYSVVAAENLRQLSPAQFVLQCCTLMDETAQKRRQNIVMENHASLPVIFADEALLRQVLEHLIGNALRYSPEQSTITVKLQDRPAQTKPPLPSAISLCIQIIDEGCGIPEKELTAIFEPFYESSRTSTGAGSTGLGLALCKAIVERHKGKLTAANRPEGGSIFEVILPA